MISYSDAEGREWNPEQLQTLLLKLGTYKDVALRLRKPLHEVRPTLRAMGVKTPMELIRDVASNDPVSFKDSIIREGGITQASQYHNVSRASLKKVLEEIGVSFTIPRDPRKDKMKPTEYVRLLATQDPDALRNLVLILDRPQKVTSYFGVSLSFLRNQMTEGSIQWRHRTPTAEESAKALEMFGSMEMAARHLGTKVSELKKALDNWRELTDPLKTGRNSVTTGRIGENYWFSLRKNQTKQNLALTNPNFPDYDFIDQEFGRVNVKAAIAKKAKKKDLWSWSWEIKPAQLADNFALVLLDSKRQPLGMFMLARNEMGEITFPPGVQRKRWQTGDYGVMVRAESEDPKVGNNFNGRPVNQNGEGN